MISSLNRVHALSTRVTLPIAPTYGCIGESSWSSSLYSSLSASPAVCRSGAMMSWAPLEGALHYPGFVGGDDTTIRIL